MQFQRTIMERLKIGISACFMHKDPTRAIFKGKTLLYVEESLAHWAMRLGAIAFMIPSVPEGGKTALAEYAEELDGLILHGGADVAPETYGETPLKEEWKGDRVRDLYEMELFHAFRTSASRFWVSAAALSSLTWPSVVRSTRISAHRCPTH